MRYESIRKLYFTQGRERAQSAREARLASASAVVLDFSIGDYPSFFVVDNDLLNLISEIYKINTRLCTLQGVLPGVALEQYARDILIKEIGLTNEIENIHSTRREIESSLDELEQKKTASIDARFAGMIEKYKRLQEGKKMPLRTCEEIRELYNQLVLPEVRRESPQDVPDGEIFRAGPVYVRNKHNTVLHEGIYPERKIYSAMDCGLRFLNDESYNLLIRVAVFHFMFAYIHPFYDGNGRMSRFISSYMLSQELSPLAALQLSYAIKEERKKYYRLFEETNDKRNMGDLTPFVQGFLSLVLKDIQNTYEFLENSNATINRLNRIFDHHARVPKNHAILWILSLNALFAESGLSMNDLLRSSNKSRMTVQKELDLYSNGWKVLRSHKDGRKTIYRLDLMATFDFLERTLND